MNVDLGRLDGEDDDQPWSDPNRRDLFACGRAVRGKGLGNAKVVYFHGVPKPTDLNEPWVTEHWR